MSISISIDPIIISIDFARRSEGNLIRLTGFLPGRAFCRRGQCLIRRAEIFVALLLNRGTFFLTFAGANGTRFVFSITCISGKHFDGFFLEYILLFVFGFQLLFRFLSTKDPVRVVPVVRVVLA